MHVAKADGKRAVGHLPAHPMQSRWPAKAVQRRNSIGRSFSLASLTFLFLLSIYIRFFYIFLSLSLSLFDTNKYKYILKKNQSIPTGKS